MPLYTDPKSLGPYAHAGLILEAWLAAVQMSYSAFAREVPCSTSYPRLLAQGHARPSYEMAQRIEDLTNGTVTRELWYPPSTDKVEEFEL